jgi:hypothetical protein
MTFFFINYTGLLTRPTILVLKILPALASFHNIPTQAAVPSMVLGSCSVPSEAHEEVMTKNLYIIPERTCT